MEKLNLEKTKLAIAELAEKMESTPLSLREMVLQRISELNEEKKKFIPEREAQLKSIQQKISEDQNHLNAMLNESNAYVAGIEASVKELENLLSMTAE